MRREVCEFRWLHIPYGDAARILVADPARILEPAAAGGLRRARELLATLEADVAGYHVERDAIVEIASPNVNRGAFPIVRIPLRWRAATHPELFPVMDGHLEAYPIAPDRTQLTFQGSYTPPLGRLGDALDALALHRVATSTVERFLRYVAQRVRRTWLETRADTTSTAPDRP